MNWLRKIRIFFDTSPKVKSDKYMNLEEEHSGKSFVEAVRKQRQGHEAKIGKFILKKLPF